MKIWTLTLALSSALLTACIGGPPTTADIEPLMKARIEGARTHTISEISVSNLNCSKRESRYDCEYDYQAKGTYKKYAGLIAGTFTPKFEDAPYERKAQKIRMSLTKGDKGWLEVPF